MTDQLPPFTPSREMPSYTPAPAVPPPPSPGSAYKFGSTASYSGGRTSKAMATWALVLGVFPLCGGLVAIGLGVCVLLRARDGRNHGQFRAVVGMVFATLWLVLGVAAASMGLLGQADRNPAGVVTQPGDVQVTDVKVGDCLPAQVATEKVSYKVAVTPCSTAHLAEVYADFELAAGPFPGNAQVTRVAEGGCIKRFAPFVGVRYNRSDLDVTFLQPLRATWSQDRVVTCMLAAKTPTTGTLQGSRR